VVVALAFYYEVFVEVVFAFFWVGEVGVGVSFSFGYWGSCEGEEEGVF